MYDSYWKVYRAGRQPCLIVLPSGSEDDIIFYFEHKENVMKMEEMTLDEALNSNYDWQSF